MSSKRIPQVTLIRNMTAKYWAIYVFFKIIAFSVHVWYWPGFWFIRKWTAGQKFLVSWFFESSLKVMTIYVSRPWLEWMTHLMVYGSSIPKLFGMQAVNLSDEFTACCSVLHSAYLQKPFKGNVSFKWALQVVAMWQWIASAEFTISRSSQCFTPACSFERGFWHWASLRSGVQAANSLGEFTACIPLQCAAHLQT